MIRLGSRFSFSWSFPFGSVSEHKHSGSFWLVVDDLDPSHRASVVYMISIGGVIIPSSFCCWPIMELLCSIGASILISGCRRGPESPDVLQTPYILYLWHQEGTPDPRPGGATTHTVTNTPAPDAAVWRCSMMSSTPTYSAVCQFITDDCNTETSILVFLERQCLLEF